ncbi:MAG: helix-turn-helix domain-containing protein [Ruminococcus sp.]|uniref:helix-turn-helix domain-containing protein n=1 Tax=Ruminococcus sp. TaxID=41978 RepID=UPI0025ECF9F5|nr:helix-turn-helix domain-containing protein [Ruminococcus sp.]MBR5683433.1 helix-turn-helix domain-containing protein [Ruminococcus sp.]
MSDEMMTVSQAAEYLKVCNKTILRLINTKKITASKVGNRWRIKNTDIDKYIRDTANSSDRGDNDE